LSEKSSCDAETDARVGTGDDYVETGRFSVCHHKERRYWRSSYEVKYGFRAAPWRDEK
jgi:hypothetical protein